MNTSTALCFVGVVALSSTPVAVADEKVVTAPNGIAVRCSDFRRLPNGEWESKPEATITFPTRKGSFGYGVYGPSTPPFNGVRISQLLSDNCQP